MKKTEPDPDGLAAAVAQVRAAPEALTELESLYLDVDAQLAAMGQTCRACGECCDFGRFDHRLYLTTIELALLTTQPGVNPEAIAEGRCPYQDGAACGARERRALGCRVYSCDRTTDAAEQELYDRYHRRLGEIHDTHGLAYLYVDLIAALGRLTGLTSR